jgi:hypothetical protein
VTTEQNPRPTIVHEAQCKQCGKKIELQQDSECPALRVPAWIGIAVCDRCGKYREQLRAIDDNIASVSTKWAVASGSRDPSAARAECSAHLTKLTQSLIRLLMQRWGTNDTWSIELVDLLLDAPEKTRIAVRTMAREHQIARERADREATKQGRLTL